MARVKKSSRTTSKKTTKKPVVRSDETAKNAQLAAPLPSAWRLTRRTIATLKQHRVVLGGVLLVYGILQLVLVQGVLASNFVEIRQAIEDAVSPVWGGTATSALVLSYLVANVGQADTAEASMYQLLLWVVGSLAFIWCLRHLFANTHAIRIRDGYYQGMYPLIPFILVLLVIGLQLIPAGIGTWVYAAVMTNGIAVTLVEQLAWLAACVLLVAVSIYLVCASFFALYIVTLPQMTPIKALRSASGIVKKRRWEILRKLLFLGFLVVLLLAVVMLPIISFVPVLAPAVFYGLGVMFVGAFHTYGYILYRELIKEDG